MKWFKRLLLAVGSLVVLSVLCFILFFVTVGRQMDADSKKAAESTALLIGKNWAWKEIEPISDDAMKGAVKESPDQSQKLFQAFSEKLGALKSVSDITGDARVSYTTQDGKQVIGSYQMAAHFEKAEGSISITLSKVGDRWLLRNFNVNSNALMPG